MAKESKTRRRWRDVILLFSAAVGVIVPHYAGKSEFATVVFVAALACACQLYQAFLGDPSDWTLYNRWVLRIFAVGAGVWLCFATPTIEGRIAAVLLYAALYAGCEWVVWHR